MAIRQGKDICETVLNYKKDGTAFWNRLIVGALRDIQGNIVNYIGVQSEVASPKLFDGKQGKAKSGFPKVRAPPVLSTGDDGVGNSLGAGTGARKAAEQLAMVRPPLRLAPPVPGLMSALTAST